MESTRSTTGNSTDNTIVLLIWLKNNKCVAESSQQLDAVRLQYKELFSDVIDGKKWVTPYPCPY